jgi:hypothetical protein
MIFFYSCGQSGNDGSPRTNNPQPTQMATPRPTPSPPTETEPPVAPSPSPGPTSTPQPVPPPGPTPTPDPAPTPEPTMTPEPSPTPTPNPVDNPPTQSSSFGAIRGTVTTSGGSPLNAVHVRAVNVTNNGIQIGAFSGIDSGLTLSDGAYFIQGLPPGKYRVLIEKIDGRGNVTPNTLGSFVSSNAPNLVFPDEYFNGNRESADDDPDDLEEVTVFADQTTDGIDFITND